MGPPQKGYITPPPLHPTRKAFYVWVNDSANEIKSTVYRQPPSQPLSNIAYLTHWGRLTHICVGKLTIIGSDNGLSPGRHQTIIWTNDWILLIGPLGTNFSEIFIKIQNFSFTKMHLKISSGKMAANLSRERWVNTTRPEQHGPHFADDIFKCISFNGNWVSLKFFQLFSISLKFVSNYSTDNISALVEAKDGLNRR